jgi:hypothetical protein
MQSQAVSRSKADCFTIILICPRPTAEGDHAQSIRHDVHRLSMAVETRKNSFVTEASGGRIEASVTEAVIIRCIVTEQNRQPGPRGRQSSGAFGFAFVLFFDGTSASARIILENGCVADL